MPYMKMYTADNGDAFMIKDNTTNPIAILIGGGYATTFRTFICAAG